MIKFAKDAELLPDSSPEGSDRAQRKVTEAIKSVQGILAGRAKHAVPQAAELPSHNDALDRVRAPLAAGNSNELQQQVPVQPEQTPPNLPFPLEATSTQAATGIESPVYSKEMLTKDIKNAGIAGLALAGGVGAINGGMIALKTAGAGFAPSVVGALGGATALSTGAQAGLLGLSLYGGGMLHKLVWNTPPEKSGFWRTIGRGLLSGASVPGGILDYVLLNGKFHKMFESRRKAA